MSSFKSPFLREVEARGFFHQCSHAEELDVLLAKESVCFYIGYDATAPSLHVGNLMTIMLMRLAQRHGHKPIVLMGGATTRVADPSGKDKTRPSLSEEAIAKNIGSIKHVFKKYLSFEGGDTQAILLNNDDWLASLNYLEFLGAYGPHFTINRMLTFDSVRLRLEREHPLTFLEFNYMILQAYDFLKLYDERKCVLQMGGSDQWGNILNGVELIRRLRAGSAFGLTIPLITTSSGAKMGKSASGAVWLNGDMLSPYDYWQYWRNTEDADVMRFLKYFTDLPLEEIKKYELAEGAALNEVKILLADEATRLAHGSKALDDIHASVAKLFGEKEADIEVIGKDENGNPILHSSVPILKIERHLLEQELAAYQLVEKAGLAASNGEAKRLIQGGGCRINDERIDDPFQKISLDMVKSPGVIKLSAGKKRFAFVQVV